MWTLSLCFRYKHHAVSSFGFIRTHSETWLPEQCVCYQSGVDREEYSSSMSAYAFAARSEADTDELNNLFTQPSSPKAGVLIPHGETRYFQFGYGERIAQKWSEAKPDWNVVGNSLLRGRDMTTLDGQGLLDKCVN